MSKEFSDALDGDRASALVMWRSIADGNTDPEALAWVRHVARSVLEADKSKQAARTAAIVAAVGLSGSNTKARDDLIETWLLLDPDIREREIWRRLADAGLADACDDGPVPGAVRQAIRKARTRRA